MDLEQKIVNLIADIENIIENNKDIYTNTIMEKDFRKNYWNYCWRSGDEEIKWFWNKKLAETIVSFATDRIAENRNSCSMRKKDITENQMRIYDCWELARLSVKSRELYKLLCSLETKNNKEPFVRKVEENMYQFYYMDSRDKIDQSF